jgi:D-sedoheptulose 7-phosphate isomerase
MSGNIIKKSIEKSLQETLGIIKEISLLDDEIVSVINEIVNAIKQGKKIILFGNGGSAADAQHIAAEFIGRFNIERQSFPAIALSTDTSVITSLGNDYSFDIIFSRQCESLVAEGDIVIGISTSGNSKNVENGLIVSKKNGAHTIGLLGNDGGLIKKIVDIPLIVNSSSTPRIQEAHRVLYHIICDIVEKELAAQLKN